MIIENGINILWFKLTYQLRLKSLESAMRKFTQVCFITVTAFFSVNKAHAVTAEEASDLAGLTGCAMLILNLPLLPEGKVLAGAGCKLLTQIAKEQVANIIDSHFDGKDQAFANEYCLTIVKGDGSKITPADTTNCQD